MTKNFSVLEARMSSEAYASVWDALSDTSSEAGNLKVRSELMQQLSAVIQGRSWTPAEAAHYSGIDPSRIDDLLRGSISRFSLDALVDISARLGQQVRVRLESR